MALMMREFQSELEPNELDALPEYARQAGYGNAMLLTLVEKIERRYMEDVGDGRSSQIRIGYRDWQALKKEFVK